MLGLGVEDYGSGSETEGEASTKLTQPKKNTLSLPPPSSSKAPVKTKKKVAIGLPSLKPAAADDEDELQSEMPPAKKPKIGAGAGSSSLLSMLPAPKQKAPIAAAPERVLGGGKGPGLVFNTSRSATAALSSSDTQIDSTPVDSEAHSNSEEFTSSSTAFAFRPPSLAKGKANISLEEEKPRANPKVTVSSAPAVDFFGLSSASSSSSKISLPTSAPSISISSAPALPTFDIPEPSVNDPYPGYYQLPSGEWRQHDSDYYEKFRRRWEKEYNDHVRALEKGAVKGFEGYERGEVADVDAAKEMERAKKEVKEREERKAISKMRDGEPAKPKMNITASKMSGVARSRHQLATLLHEAYQNKEMLEEKIAEGKRNRKEAGNKYGF